jgi:hypothetical protein
METKTCQKCKNEFTITQDDFGFYEQMKVPAPVWCPRCRLLRRMNWYGYRILYKRKCDFTGENIITFYHPDVPGKIYRQDIWWSDQWDPKSYGKDYDFSRPFFEQFKELFDTVPKAALHTEYTTMVNSDYCNGASFMKNGYLCFKHITGEDSAYTNTVLRTKDTLDAAFSSDPELCYEIIDVRKCFQTFFSQDCENCNNVYFSRDLVGCSDCFGCTSLRNKSYHFFNEQLTKEEYQKRVEQFNLGSIQNVEKIKKQAYELSLKYPRRASQGRNNSDISGDYVYNSKNAHEVYFVSDSENIKFCELFFKGGVKNCYDFTSFGSTSEWIYESNWTGLNESNVKFAVWNYRNHDTEYTFGCHGAGYLFGCVGIRKGEYCILNKQYTKEEYFELVGKIKKQMNDITFVDRLGLEHRYGGQVPVDICPWAYNESTAYEFFPLTKEEALKQGFTWRDPDPREYMDATIVVPDDIKDVTDDILKAILKCNSCGKNYQIIPKELQFLRRFNFPVPHDCPLCRDRNRIKQMNPMETYQRSCAKCNADIQTSYAPNRSEIVYCEKCYQQELY